jgi:hypothetical protein
MFAVTKIRNIKGVPMVRTLIASVLVLLTGVASALDTTEAFDPGFSDLEFYMAYTGLDNQSASSVVSWETLLGIGLTERFSSFVTMSVSSNGYLDNSEDAMGMGLFWTAIDGEGMKLDLCGSTGTGGAVSAGLEVNLDQSDWGFQLQAAETVENGGTNERSMSTELQPLLYYRTPCGAEFLAAVDFAYAEAEDGDNEFDWSTCSAGVNFMVTENIEAITQLDVVNSGDDETDVGISLGIVAGV